MGKGRKEMWMFWKDEAVALHAISRGKGLPNLLSESMSATSSKTRNGKKQLIIPRGGAGETEAGMSGAYLNKAGLPKAEIKVIITGTKWTAMWVDAEVEARTHAYGTPVPGHEGDNLTWATGWTRFRRVLQNKLNTGKTIPHDYDQTENATLEVAGEAFGYVASKTYDNSPKGSDPIYRALALARGETRKARTTAESGKQTWLPSEALCSPV